MHGPKPNRSTLESIPRGFPVVGIGRQRRREEKDRGSSRARWRAAGALAESRTRVSVGERLKREQPFTHRDMLCKAHAYGAIGYLPGGNGARLLF